MNIRQVLYLGIVLLVIGILFQCQSQLEEIGIYLIIGGVLCKLAYITSVIKSGLYQIGMEILFLLAGLVLFYIGKSDLGNTLLSEILMGSGISLKIIFVIIFIRKIRAGKKNISGS